jgi:uncharacterized damage-inducible protein DinB
MDDKETLHRYLRKERDSLVAKLDGLSERDVRWPMTPTGTNLLGLVKHVASIELGYLGEVFGRPSGIDLPWFEDGAELNADMWATADESRAEIVDLYRRAAEYGDATIATLPLDAPGTVPWWGDRGQVTLQRILVHLIAEIARHAGHADILRELLDGSAGNNDGNLPSQTAGQWAAYRSRLEQAATAAADAGPA